MSYPFKTMSDDELAAFLDEPRHAIVATNRHDGQSQLSAVWFVYETGRFFFSIQSTSVKHANLRRDPRLAVCVDAGHPDARSVAIYGTAQLRLDAEATPDPLHARIARRYLSNQADTIAYLQKARAVSPLVLVALAPDRVLAHDYN